MNLLSRAVAWIARQPLGEWLFLIPYAPATVFPVAWAQFGRAAGVVGIMVGACILCFAIYRAEQVAAASRTPDNPQRVDVMFLRNMVEGTFLTVATVGIFSFFDGSQ